MVIQAEKFTNSPEFNHALEFSMVAHEISDDDTLTGVRHSPEDSPQTRRQRCYERIRSLKERDPEKYKYLYRTPILKMIHTHAYEATAAPSGMLMIKAAKLRLNMRDVTPANLALELKISVATLYRQYDANLVKQTCDGQPIHDEVPAKVCYQIA